MYLKSSLVSTSGIGKEHNSTYMIHMYRKLCTMNIKHLQYNIHQAFYIYYVCNIIVDSKKCYKPMILHTSTNGVLIPLHHSSKAPLEIRLGYCKLSWWMQKERTNTIGMIIILYSRDLTSLLLTDKHSILEKFPSFCLIFLSVKYTEYILTMHKTNNCIVSSLTCHLHSPDMVTMLR